MNKSYATYRVGDAFAVTQQLPDGTWIATFPGFRAFGATESDALGDLGREVEGAAKQISLLHLQTIEVR